jgi:HSP20 family protein
MKTLAKRNGEMTPSLVSDFFSPSPLWSSLWPTGLFDVDVNDLPARLGVTVPSANVMETEKEYQIELAVPGLQKKDFKIEMENDVLTISAEKEEEKNEKENGYTRREYAYNSFTRSFTMPENFKLDKIDAKYVDGILKITVPKKEVTPMKPKKEIAVS